MKNYYFCGSGWYNTEKYFCITDRDFSYSFIKFNGLGFRLTKKLKPWFTTLFVDVAGITSRKILTSTIVILSIRRLETIMLGFDWQKN